MHLWPLSPAYFSVAVPGTRAVPWLQYVWAGCFARCIVPPAVKHYSEPHDGPNPPGANARSGWKNGRFIDRFDSVAGVIQLVECQLPKLDVAGSSPVARSLLKASLLCDRPRLVDQSFDLSHR